MRDALGQTRYVFVTGGVVSSLGKGLAAAALAALLQARGHKVRLRKLDPYLNVDAGTMSPYQHGEVFVTDDGAETDLDLGHYERFTGVAAKRADSITAGRIYRQVIEKERRGDYQGATVQVVPHVTNAIKTAIRADIGDADVVICEIGGTIGDIEGLPFIEAIRQLRSELPPRAAAHLHVTLVPYIASAGELKTKPTQHSVRELRAVGIQPDVLLCRCERELPHSARAKIATQCSVRPEAVIAAEDCRTIYEVPMAYCEQGLDAQVMQALDLPVQADPDLGRWTTVVERATRPDGRVRIAIVGKYVELADAYKSLGEALSHGGFAHDVAIEERWISARELDTEAGKRSLDGAHAILVPGGFGERGVDGKLAAIRYAREHRIPFLGICLGMQLACIEAARNLGGMSGAGSTEFDRDVADPIVGLLTEWEKDGRLETRREGGDLGGTMRLGAYPCMLREGSLASRIYGGAREIHERHRHRYEVNRGYLERLEQTGLAFSGVSPDGRLPEILELPGHPWFLGVQFHPELKSLPFAPHPIFASFVAAALAQSRLV